MGSFEPGEAQGGKPRRKKGASLARRPRRGGRGGPQGASDRINRADGEGKRRDDANKVASKGINEPGSKKAEAEKKKEVRTVVNRNGDRMLVAVCSFFGIDVIHPRSLKPNPLNPEP